MIVINIFTTREIAVAIIFAVIFIWLFSKKECRKGFANLLQACCKKVLLIPFALLLIYGALITYGITKLSFWNWIYLKDILLWINDDYIYELVEAIVDGVSEAIEKNTKAVFRQLEHELKGRR